MKDNSVKTVICGAGTYTTQNEIFSSLTGYVHTKIEKTYENNKNLTKFIISVRSFPPTSENLDKKMDIEPTEQQPEKPKSIIFNEIVIPKIGDVIIGRVIALRSNSANLLINSIIIKNPQPNMPKILNLAKSLPGTVKSQDVRLTEIDTVVIHESFRVGDLVKAEVISMGDLFSYYLSTARADLGVIEAKSTSGGMLLPINHKEMQCIETGAKEPRKVAKPDSE